MITPETWDILAERCAQIRWFRHEQETTDRATLEFDNDDQARVVTQPPEGT